MSELAENQESAAPFEGVAEAIQDTPEIEQQPEQPQQTNGKAPGYDPVDFATATPEELKQRYDYLYKQVKDGKRTEKTLNEFRRIAAEQAQRIEELTTGFTGVVDHLTNQSFAEKEAALENKFKEAYETGDTVKLIALQRELAELTAKKIVAEKEKKQAPKQEQKPANNAAAIAKDAYEDGEISFEDKSYVNAWQDERDESGNLLRPWAFNRSSDPSRPDPQHIAALAETQAVFMSPRFANATMEQKMAEVDRRMGTQTRSGRQNVMGGNLTSAKKPSKITLSSKQQEIATRTKFAGPGKSDAEHLEAYRKQIEQTRKGAK